MGSKYFTKLKDNQLMDEEECEELDYKKKYYSLIRDLARTHTMMCDRCPLVKSCCGGCNLLKKKIQKLKKD